MVPGENYHKIKRETNSKIFIRERNIYRKETERRESSMTGDNKEEKKPFVEIFHPMVVSKVKRMVGE